MVVTNTGDTYAADEVVLAYYKPRPSTIPSLAATGEFVGPTPVVIKQLFAFERVHLSPGSSVTLQFTVNATTLRLGDHLGHISLHPGLYDIAFSRGCVGCEELVAEVAVLGTGPVRLESFRS